MEERLSEFDELKQAFEDLQKQADDAVSGGLQEFVEIKRLRSARLANVAAKLVAPLGEDHPQVKAIRESAVMANNLQKTAYVALHRLDVRPQPKPEEMAIFGRVQDESGKPLTGAVVKIETKAERSAETLKRDLSTSEDGDFSMTFNRTEIERLNKRPKKDAPSSDAESSEQEVTVRVEDAQGNLLHRASVPLRFTAEHSHFFDIVVPKSNER